MLKNKATTAYNKLTFNRINLYFFATIFFFLFSNKVISATIYFNNIYKATGTSYSLNTQNLVNINLISGTGFKFTSANPNATIFNSGNDEDGILSYTNTSGVLISIYGSISRQSKSGNTTLAVNFIPTNSTYTTPTGEAYLLVIPGKEGSFSNGIDVNTSSDPIDPVLNALLSSQASSPVISISNVSVLQNAGYAVFTVSLSNAANATITFTPTLTNVTAIGGIDYTNSMQYYNGTTWVTITSTLSIAQNSTSLQIRVPIINYNTSVTNKTFNLNTGAISGGNVLNNYGTYGIGTILVPVITKSGSLTAFTACSGSVSAEQNFTVSGTNLVSDLTITAPTGYEVSLTSGSSFAGFVTLTPTSNTVNSTTIYVRLKNDASNGASGNIVCSATSASSVNVSTGTATVNALPSAPVGTNGSSVNPGTVSISGSVNSGETIDWYANSTGGSPLSGGTGTTNFTTPSISSTTIYYAQARNTTTGCVSATRTAVTASITANATPTITTSGTLTAFSSCLGSVSSEQSFSVSGIDLVADIVVTAPTGYEISLTSGGTFSSSITLTQTASTVGATTIYVRLKSDASNGVSGNISCTSTNAATQTVSTGTATVNNLPTVTLSNSANTVTYDANSQTTTISYSNTTGNPTTYSITWNANPSNSFATVTNANLSSSPININVPAGANTGTYTGILTVTNASNCTSSNNSFTVTINSNDFTAPTITFPISQNNNGSSSLKISENTSSVTTFTANEPVTWSITGGSESGLFSINSTSGLLTFNSAPTFANPMDSAPTNSYIVQITATDSNGNFSRQMLTVFISPLCGNWNN